LRLSKGLRGRRLFFLSVLVKADHKFGSRLRVNFPKTGYDQGDTTGDEWPRHSYHSLTAIISLNPRTAGGEHGQPESRQLEAIDFVRLKRPIVVCSLSFGEQKL